MVFAKVGSVVSSIAGTVAGTAGAVAFGAAAFNIGDSTLHYALKLPVMDGHGSTVRSSYNESQGEALEDLCQLWQGVRYLIIDDISMVSAQQLSMDISSMIR